MRIAYLHRITFDESEVRFFEEASKLGIDLVSIKYRKLRFVEGKILFGDIDLKEMAGIFAWLIRVSKGSLRPKHNIPMLIIQKQKAR
jgi:hypothetical protein